MFMYSTTNMFMQPIDPKEEETISQSSPSLDAQNNVVFSNQKYLSPKQIKLLNNLRKNNSCHLRACMPQSYSLCLWIPDTMHWPFFAHGLRALFPVFI